jgi:hypothetical protein
MAHGILSTLLHNLLLKIASDGCYLNTQIKVMKTAAYSTVIMRASYNTAYYLIISISKQTQISLERLSSWYFPRRLSIKSRRFGTLCLFYLQQVIFIFNISIQHLKGQKEQFQVNDSNGT